MRRVILFLGAVVVLIGCQKQKPDTPQGAVGNPGTPTPGTTKEPGPSREPAGTGTPGGTAEKKDGVKLLAPRAVVKTGHRGGPNAGNKLFLSADGTRLAVALDEAKKTQIWDVAGEPKRLLEIPGVAQAFSPDGKLFVRYAKGAFDAEVVSAEAGAVVATLQHSGFRFAFRSPDAVVGVRAGDHEEPRRPGVLVVRESDARTGREKLAFDVPYDRLNDVQLGLGATGNEVAVASAKTGRVEVWSLATRKPAREVTLAGGKPDEGWMYFELSRDGKWAAANRGATSGAGTSVFDGKTGAVAFTLPNGSSSGGFVPGRDLYAGRYITPPGVSSPGPAYLVFDLNRKAAVAVAPADGSPLAFAANGKVMATESESGEIRVWDLGQIP